MDLLLKLAASRNDTGIQAKVIPVGNTASVSGDCRCKCGDCKCNEHCGPKDCNDC